MSKIERLLNLTAVLLDTQRPLTAQELRTQVEGYGVDDSGFNRMFERDKDDLRSMGVPVEVQPSPADPSTDGYIIANDNYYLNDLELTPDELSALNLAVLTTQMDADLVNEAIWKLGGSVDVAVSPGAAQGSINVSPGLAELFKARSSSTPVGFTYGEAERLVCPWRLDFKRGRWYVVGFDVDKEAERNFRLDRISGGVVERDDLEWVAPPETIRNDRKPWEYGDNSVEAKLWVESSRVATAIAQLGPTHEIDLVDDGAIFRVDVASPDSFYALVTDYLDHAEILSPPELRDGYVARLKEVAAHYG